MRQKSCPFHKKKNNAMRKAEDFSDCRRAVFKRDDRVWQKKRPLGSMMWTTDQKPWQ